MHIVVVGVLDHADALPEHRHAGLAVTDAAQGLGVQRVGEGHRPIVMTTTVTLGTWRSSS